MRPWTLQQLAAFAASAILTLSASPALAEFTVTERAELARLYQGAETLQKALTAETFAVRDGWNSSTAPKLRNALRLTLTAYRETTLALSALLNVSLDASFDVPVPPRADEVTIAWFHLTRAVEWTGYARNALREAATVSPANAAYRAAVTEASIWIDAAAPVLAAVDRTLAYAEPFPASFPTIIGPHGVYDHAQWSLWRAGHYAFDTLDLIVAALPDSANASAYLAHTAMNSLGWVALGVTRAQMRLFMPYGSGDLSGSMSQFFRVLLALRDLTIETANFYYTVQESLGGLISALPTSTRSLILQRLVDSWRHMDEGIWMTLDFPTCTPAQSAEGCGGL